MNKSGVLVVFSGPSGSGKGTVLAEYFKAHPEAAFSVSATTRAPRPGEVDGVNYHFVTRERFEEMIRAGEVLGFSGLIGAGRTEIMRCIFGLDRPDGGEIYLNGELLHIRSAADAIRAGICLVSEDRRREGIVPAMSVRENITLPSLDRISRAGVIDRKQERDISGSYIESLSIKTPTPEQLIGNLSGGNQQKCCLAKWLARSPKLIILDEPTRGIDVGAKAEIHDLIDALTKQGMAVVMIPSELPEIMGASDRIIVLYEGRKMAEFNCVTEEITQEKLMETASGIAVGA